MINLSSILESAQGGQAIDNLAARFGLPPEQARSAVEALLPALQMGLQKVIAGGGLGALIGSAAGTFGQAHADPDAAQSPAVEQHGRSVLGDLFGGAGNTASVAQQAAVQSGVPASIIQAMLPVLVSMLMGGLLKQGGEGGLGGLLSGVLGSLFGRHAPPAAAPGPTSPQPGGFGDVLGNILGGVVGGGAHPAPSRPADPAPPIEAPPESAHATLDEISDMITAGTPPAPEHEAALAEIVRR